jgi:hypothetical protein
MKLHWQQGKCVKSNHKKKIHTHPVTWNGTAELVGLPACSNILVTQDNQLSVTHNDITMAYLVTL